MSRPNFITQEDIDRWSLKIDQDPNISKGLASSDAIREVCYSGQYLVEQLQLLNCPDYLIGQIQFSAGAACFGKDPWEIHLQVLNDYKLGKLQFDLISEDFNHIN